MEAPFKGEAEGEITEEASRRRCFSSATKMERQFPVTGFSFCFTEFSSAGTGLTAIITEFLPGFSFDVTGFYRIANRVQSLVRSLPSFYRVFISIFQSYWVLFYRVYRLEQVPCDHYRVFTGFFV